MQKIIINNFLSVKNAEIVVPKMLVLIGEQSSGKSTVAKLIYFFKSLSQNLFFHIYGSETSFEFEKDILHQIKLKFYGLFGSKTDLKRFNIKYYYDVENEKYLQLSVNETNKLTVIFSNNMFTENVLKELYELKESCTILFNSSEDDLNRVVHDSQIKIVYEKLFELLESIFNNSNNPLFMPTGRAMTATYSNLFERYIFANVSDINSNNERENSNEFLMFKFLQRVDYMKSYFLKNNDFETAIKTYLKNTNNRKSQLYSLKRNIEEILKGEYIVNNSGEEKIINSKGQVTNLSDLSTGQKEIIRILQDIFMSMVTDESVFRVIEEPESNLHPIVQKQLIELLCLLVNDSKDNQIIITTNSPYILNILNNLLFATKVTISVPTEANYIDKYIPVEYHLNSSELAIYSLGNEEMEEDYCLNIFNSKTGVIKQNYLDIVFEMLNYDYQSLFKLYMKSQNNK